MTSSIQITEEKLDNNRVNDICGQLHGDSLRVLSLRECDITDKGFNALVKAVGQSKCLLQLSLSLGVIKDFRRVDALAKSIQKNQYLVALFIHGNPIGNKGMLRLCKALTQHPGIISLDVGDCDLGDKAMDALCNLLPPNGDKPGLMDLSLSANPNISTEAWNRFGLAVAASSGIRELYVDYNRLGDFSACCLLVGLASSRKIQILDLEGTSITDKTAQLLLHLIENYPVQFKKIILDENDIEASTKLTIKDYIDDNDEGDSVSIQTMDSKAEALGTTSRQAERNTQKSTSEASTESGSDSDEDNSQSGSSKSSTIKSDKSKGEESELKDTVRTDEDYKVLEQALEEAGQSTGKISARSENGEGDRSQESDDEGELLTEVPVISTPVLTMVRTNTQKTQIIKDDDSDEDSGEELHEVYLGR